MIIPILLLYIAAVTANFTLSNLKLPEKIGRHFAAHAVYDDVFTVLAGYDGSQYITTSRSTLINETPNNNGQWSTNSVSLPSGISRMWTYVDPGVTINNQRYIINPTTSGGTAEDRHEMFIYNLQSHQYTVSATPTYAAGDACSVYDSNQNIIYTIGGYAGGIFRRYTQRFSLSSNTWITPGALMDTARVGLGCSLDPVTDHIYVFGGFDASNHLDSIERYNGNVWSVISTTLSLARADIQCRFLSLDNNIYCIGGSPGFSLASSNIVDVFRPSDESMINTLYLNVGRAMFTATMWNNGRCIIVSGGATESISDAYLDSVETFGDCSGLNVFYLEDTKSNGQHRETQK